MRRQLALIVAFTMIVSTPAAFSVTPKIGGACTKINQFYESKSTLLVCGLVNKKKIWRKATSVEKSLYLKEKTRLAKAAAGAAAKASIFSKVSTCAVRQLLLLIPSRALGANGGNFLGEFTFDAGDGGFL